MNKELNFPGEKRAKGFLFLTVLNYFWSKMFCYFASEDSRDRRVPRNHNQVLKVTKVKALDQRFKRGNIS